MTSPKELVCDGCGQAASAEHIAERLKRLEWTTRYRPVHIQTLLLGAFSPRGENDFVYAPGGQFSGEARAILNSVGISGEGKSADAVHAEFQRAGFFLTHILECPREGAGDTDSKMVLRARLQLAAVRIRRSLKPKRVVLVSTALDLVVAEILALELGCPVVTDRGKAFDLEASETASRLREALVVASGT